MSLNDEISKLLNQEKAEVAEEKAKFEVCKGIAETRKIIAEINGRMTAAEQKQKELREEVGNIKLEHNLTINLLEIKRSEMISKITKYEEELANSFDEKKRFIRRLQDFINEHSGKIEAIDETNFTKQKSENENSIQNNLISFAEQGKEDAIVDFNLALINVDYN